MRNLALLLGLLACVGCNQEKRGIELKDVLLRQQLTAILSRLQSDKAVPDAISDIRAILAVNGSKLGPDQARLLSGAVENLVAMRRNLDAFIEEQRNYTDADRARSHAEYVKEFHEAKRLITEAASSF